MLHIVVFLLLATVTQPLAAKCPAFYEEFNMACYYYGDNAVTSVAMARETCVSLGGYLLNINAELEYQHVTDMIKVQRQVFDGYWTGGVLKNRNWVWEKVKNGLVVDTFMDPDATHYHWGPDEPNSPFPYLERYAAIMVRGRLVPYHLYSERGNLQTRIGISYICEADWME